MLFAIFTVLFRYAWLHTLSCWIFARIRICGTFGFHKRLCCYGEVEAGSCIYDWTLFWQKSYSFPSNRQSTNDTHSIRVWLFWLSVVTCTSHKYLCFALGDNPIIFKISGSANLISISIVVIINRNIYHFILFIIVRFLSPVLDFKSCFTFSSFSDSFP